MSLSKAKFTIIDGSNAGKEIQLQYNPSQYVVEDSNEFSEKKLMGLKGATHQFMGTKKSDLSLDLMFDSTSLGKDVRELIKPLELLVNIDKELHAPPTCNFSWGSFSFKGIVSSLKKDFTYFYHNGIPARVKIALTLKPYDTVEHTQALLDLHSSDISKERILNEGDSIFLMSHREYNHSSSWRLIAQKNNIDNPLLISSGSKLLIPSKGNDE